MPPDPHLAPTRHPQNRRLPGTLGNLAYLRGDYDTAEASYRQALDIFEHLGDQTGMATSYHQLGMLAQDRGDYDTAEQRYHQALTITERLGDQTGMATTYHQLGMLAHDRGDYDTAEQRYHQALDHQRAARRPDRHGHHLRPARHPRPRPG